MHDDLLFELKSFGIEGELLPLIESYLKKTQKKVVLNDESSHWKKILPGIYQGSVLGPLSVYTKNLPESQTVICKIFAGNTYLFSKVLEINQRSNNTFSSISHP